MGKEADWHKSTPARLTHEVKTRRIKKGKTVEFYAEVLSSKTNTLNVGKEYHILTVDYGEGEIDWKGIDDLKEGKL